FLYCLLPIGIASAVSFQIDEIETEFLHAHCPSEFSHSLDPLQTWSCLALEIRCASTETLKQPAACIRPFRLQWHERRMGAGGGEHGTPRVPANGSDRCRHVGTS